MRPTWKELYRRPGDTISNAIETLDRAEGNICLVVDDESRLLGTVTDGDIRRGILRGLALTDSIDAVMNKDPVVGHPDQSKADIKQAMRNRRVRQLPIVDMNGHVISLHLYDDLNASDSVAPRDNLVVLMAGGDGLRLRPLTEELPKPLLKVGNKPLLERILESFIDYKFHNFAISVNYKSELIRDYFGDGSKWNVSIQYLQENEKLGTAGSLSLIENNYDQPVIVMNGDVLTQVNFDSLLAFHSEQGADAMMCVRNYDLQIPYGVVETADAGITAIAEKPLQRFLVNAGIYVLEPRALSLIPYDTPFDMTDLFRLLIDQQRETAVFPIREYWLDIGHMDDYQRANDDISRIFLMDANP